VNDLQSLYPFSKMFRLLYEGLFAASDSDYGRTSVEKHTIATGFAHPIKQPPRRLPDVLAKEVDKQVKGMLNNEVITPSSSPWSSPVILVRKKDETTRFCVDLSLPSYSTCQYPEHRSSVENQQLPHK
jgi:hypothetical protein